MDNARSFPVEKRSSTEDQILFLVVEAQGELYAVRWALVLEAGVLLRQELDLSSPTPQVQRKGTTFPLVYLWELVQLPPPQEDLTELPAVFLEDGERRMVLVPDRILWKQEAGIKELPEWIAKAPTVRGSIVLGSGVVVVVLEPFGWESESKRVA
ncbi:MAG: chemotaxis protein CheW [Candidatus Eiseniibacteriota bacterium]|nr:MAG: chemotaxis protein CheW [Candidatus Eisenbacteria bacterium]